MSKPEIETRGVSIELALALRLARAALAALKRERQRIDGLNVYPVPDGDTGTNLVLTVEALVEELEGMEETRLSASRLGRAIGMGARGASGVILSRVVSGALEKAPAVAPLDARALAAMTRGARSAAYGAVTKPVEGTMLTFMSDLAGETRSQRRSKEPLERLLELLVQRGEKSLAATPERLKALDENGVVDAGAAGLLVCLRAITAALSGNDSGEPAPVLQLVPNA